MHIERMIAALIFALCSSSLSLAQGYWDIDIPSIPSAENVELERNEQFSALRLSYSLTITDISAVRTFYTDFFESIGWADPMAGFAVPGSAQSGMPGGWSSYAMNVDEDGTPLVQYSSSWISDNPPAMAAVNLKLLDLSNEGFQSEVTVQITPQLPLAVQNLMQIQQLLSQDPQNFFKVQKLVQGNPFDINTVNFESLTGYSGSDSTILEYISLITEILNLFEVYHQTYNQ